MNRKVTMEEYEDRAKRSLEQSLSVDTFATITGIKGVQFGREIFSCTLKFKDLMDFLEVFPEVQRDVIKRRVSKIKTYVLSGLYKDDPMRFFSAITATSRGSIYYDENTHRIAINTHESKLSLNDGQHRFYGISEAIRELQGRYNKAKDDNARQDVSKMLTDLKEMSIPLVIFNQIDEAKEKQLFHDLNNLSQRPSRSATIKLAQTDKFSQMARELALENRYFKYYGVEMDKMSIHKNNPNVVLLTTVYASLKNMFLTEYRNDFNFLNDDNYEYYKEISDKTFEQVFANLPHDINIKGKYLIEKSYTLKGITRFVHFCRSEYKVDDSIIFDTISNVDWTLNFDVWKKYGAILSKKGNILFTGGGEGGISAVYDHLFDILQNNPDVKGKIENVEQMELLS
jgi:DNA sulfur modification protein DndB